MCEATCLRHPNDADHVVPVENCTCGVYAFWTVAELLDQYLEFARHIVAVVRMEGPTIEGDNGVRANAAQIVAWWCAEDAPELATACAASAPGTRRYFDRDVMVHIQHHKPKNQKRGTKMGDIGKPRRRVIRVPATPIRKPAQEPSRPAPKPAPEPVREPARTGYHDEHVGRPRAGGPMSPVKRIPLSDLNPVRVVGDRRGAVLRGPVHHDWKRVHKLANIIAGVPVAPLAVGTAIFTMQHQTAAAVEHYHPRRTCWTPDRYPF